MRSHLLYSTLAIFAIIFAVPAASAQVSFRMSMSDSSGSSFSDSVSVENAVYSSYNELFPDSITSLGGGKASGKGASSFSESLSFNSADGKGSTVGATLDTDSANYDYKWSRAFAQGQGIDNIPLGDTPPTISLMYQVQDGSVTNSVSNQDAEILHALSIVGGGYRGMALAIPEAIKSQGIGAVIPSVDSKINEFVSMYNENDGKWSSIETEQEGESIASGLLMGAGSSSRIDALGLVMMTQATDGKATVEMDGTASNFPRQHLPPADITLSSTPVYDPANSGGSPTDNGGSSSGDPSSAGSFAPPDIINNVGSYEDLMKSVEKYWDNAFSGQGPSIPTGGTTTNKPSQGDGSKPPQEPDLSQKYPFNAEGNFAYAMKMQFIY